MVICFESNFQDKNMAYNRKLYKRAVEVTENSSTEGPTMTENTPSEKPHPHFHDINNPRGRVSSGKNLPFCCSTEHSSMCNNNNNKRKIKN